MFNWHKKERPILSLLGFGGGGSGSALRRRAGGFTVLVTPSINGQSLFNLDQEELILDGSNGTNYTITVDSSSTEENGTIQVDAWGQATAGSNAGYAGGFLNMTPSTTYVARLNAGGGSGGPSRGNGISPSGGGYAGLFNNSVSHGNSRIIAGGGGGTGSATGGSDGRSYGFGDGGSKVGAFGEAGIRDYRSELLLGDGNGMYFSQGGRGGSQTGGGAGGPSQGSGAGSSGGQLQGGNGGSSAGPNNNASGGGGGGGGYYGGGGGGGGLDAGFGTQISASGGGGSSYVHPSVIRGQIHRYIDAGVPNALRSNAGQSTNNQQSYRNARIIIRKAPETLPGVFTLNYSGQSSVSTDGDWRIVTWTSPGSFTISNTSGDCANAIDWMCMGGGGRGSNGSRGGGGGGGGEFKEGSSTISDSTYTVTVGGGGGRPGDSNGYGGQSDIRKSDNSQLGQATAGGGGRGDRAGAGGGGGADHYYSLLRPGGNGGAGGAGFDGGNTSQGVFLAGGGGGADFGGKGQGRSAHPAPPLSGPPPFGQSATGKGGDGVTSDLFGIGGGAGGGGGAQRTPGRGVDYLGPGGNPGGGAGALGNDGGPGTNGGNASAYGSGGGGAGSPASGGLGSPGIVVIRYRYQ